MLLYIYIHLSTSSENFIFIILFFWWSIEFPQQNIDQSETAIGDKKLSVGLYVIITVSLSISANSILKRKKKAVISLFLTL